MFQCTGCGGALKFDIASQKLKCSHCENEYDPYSVTGGTSATEELEFDVTVFKCSQCGGEIYSTDDTAAGFCSFCGASTILDSRMQRAVKPRYIIPFKKDKEYCKEEYIKRVRKAIFAPKEIKDKDYIDSFRGIYMPYWLYDVEQKGEVAIPMTKRYRRGDYVYTEHKELCGVIDAGFEGISHDASKGFSDTLSEQIAPYTVREKVEFTPSMLSGFYGFCKSYSNGKYSGVFEKTSCVRWI